MLEAGRPEEALGLLGRTDVWPESLGEGKLAGIRENDIQLLKGRALRMLGREEEASAMFELAASGPAELATAAFYNDQPPELIYDQGLALREFGREDAASARFAGLIAYGRARISEKPEIDCFVVSLPDFLVFEPVLAAQHQVHCRLLIALGCLGSGRDGEAADQLRRVLEIEPSHIRAARLLAGLDAPEASAGSVVDVKPKAGVSRSS